MNKEKIENIIKICMKNECKYVEVYIEKIRKKNYIYIYEKLDDIIVDLSLGIGIRLKYNNKMYYFSFSEINYDKIIKKLQAFFKNNKTEENNDLNFELDIQKNLKMKDKIDHNKIKIEEKNEFIRNMSGKIKSLSKNIIDVKQMFCEYDKEFTVANCFGRYITSDEITTRYNCKITAAEGKRKESTFRSVGVGQGYDFLEQFDKNEFANNIVSVTLKKLHTMPFSGGEMPVILGNGFGAVIFHEACGHALEATALEDGLSVFYNMLNEKIASEKVTLIDDGTIKNSFGTTIIDGEGNKTQKNILIENGILKKYLIDYINGQNMNLPITGSGRRENYQYPPTSRMNNTYLASGTDTFSDMLKSIKYGLYCKTLGGGSVNPKTGEFNFTADENYIIRNGKLCEMIGTVTLIGKGQEILKKVEMVGNDLKLESGYCGSKSGTINVTIGQPTIKVSNILVGGNK